MRTVQVDVPPRIILKIDERVCVVGNHVLNVFNSDFELINKTDILDCLDGAATDVHGNIIYSCRHNHTVKKMNNSLHTGIGIYVRLRVLLLTQQETSTCVGVTAIISM